MSVPSPLEPGALNWYLDRLPDEKFAAFWRTRPLPPLPVSAFSDGNQVWVEIGAGSGNFFVEMARQMPEITFVPIERDKERALTLIRRASKAGLRNLHAVRGNAVPIVFAGIPANSVDRLFILYPCPWPKPSHRKNRWYLHPAMPRIVEVIRPGGLLVWASDQSFYLEEARYACAQRFGLEIVSHGQLAPGPYNCLDRMPGGRSKFERTFLEKGEPCYELIVRKPAS